MTVTHTTIASPIGPLTLVADDGVLSGLYMEGARGAPGPSALGRRTGEGFEAATAQLEAYFAGSGTGFTVPVRMRGSAFQRRVWQALTRIPYGQTRSYAEVAREVAEPGQAVDHELVRAVGAANARNRLAIVVPCHRVIGADGSLTGYAGGLERKRFLLDLERGRVQLDLGAGTERWPVVAGHLRA